MTDNLNPAADEAASIEALIEKLDSCLEEDAREKREKRMNYDKEFRQSVVDCLSSELKKKSECDADVAERLVDGLASSGFNIVAWLSGGALQQIEDTPMQRDRAIRRLEHSRAVIVDSTLGTVAARLPAGTRVSIEFPGKYGGRIERFVENGQLKEDSTTDLPW